MKLDQNDFPIMTMKDTKLSNDKKVNHEKECLDSDPWCCCEYSGEFQNTETINEARCATRYEPTEVRDRYRFLEYLIDPGGFRIPKVVTVLASVMPDEVSHQVKGHKTMKLDIKHKLHVRYGVEFEVCTVGGKLKRKIRHVQGSFWEVIKHQRSSMIRWETLRNQVANRVNNQPISTGEIVLNIGNLDILISNKFILGRNNDRCPTGPLTVTSDPRKIIRANMTSRTNKRRNRRSSNSSS